MDTTIKKPRVQEVTQFKKRSGRRKGYFNPNNPEKYEGNVKNIIYRSGIELRMMKYFDVHPSVLTWSSEEVRIPYVSPLDGKVHRYFVDFKATTRLRNGSTKIRLIELKWHTAVKEPKVPKRKTRRYFRELKDWTVNCAKWSAAKKLCEEKGWEWAIITEKDLAPKA